MKIGTPGHLKFKNLKRRLAEFGPAPEYAVVGILESIWMACAQYKDHGGIGEWTNVEIAAQIGWDGNANQLIEALVESRWLDRCDEYRLVVHDWDDHMPFYVKERIRMRAKRRTVRNIPEQFAPNPTQPNPTQYTPSAAQSLRRRAPRASEPAKAEDPHGDTSPHAREPDPIWDTVTEIFFPGGVGSRAQKTRVGRIVRELKGESATGDEIKRRVKNLRQVWEGRSFTPEALLKHWSTQDAISGGSGAASASVPTLRAERVLQGWLTEHQAGTPRRSQAIGFVRDKLNDQQRKEPAIVALLDRFSIPVGARREAP